MKTPPGTCKVRRELSGGKRGDGRSLQVAGRRVTRPDPARIRTGAADPSLTRHGGLLGLGR